MTHCNHREHSHSNWECFFKSTACRRRYMARSVISCNNGGAGGSGYASGINPGRSSISADFYWMRELLWEPEGGSTDPSWLQISCVTLATPTDCSITQFLHLLNERECHMLSMAPVLHHMQSNSNELKIIMTYWICATCQARTKNFFCSN